MVGKNCIIDAFLSMFRINEYQRFQLQIGSRRNYFISKTMNHYQRQSRPSKKQSRVASQLPNLSLGKVIKVSRSKSQLLAHSQLNFKPDPAPPAAKKFHKMRIISKDSTPQTSSTSCEYEQNQCQNNGARRSITTLAQTNWVNKEIASPKNDTCSVLSKNSVREIKDIEILLTETPSRQYSRQNQESQDEKEDYILTQDDYEDFKKVLPIQINTFTVRSLTWEDFGGEPLPNSQWRAHTYWTVGYTYEIQMRKMKKSNNIRYRLTIQSWALLTDKCWVRCKWPRLLEHETGHYLIGCICALEFKKRFKCRDISRADKQKYTNNYRIETQKLFNSVFREYLQIELNYDHETGHSRNQQSQKRWNQSLIDQIMAYKDYFEKGVPKKEKKPF